MIRVSNLTTSPHPPTLLEEAALMEHNPQWAAKLRARKRPVRALVRTPRVIDGVDLALLRQFNPHAGPELIRPHRLADSIDREVLRHFNARWAEDCGCGCGGSCDGDCGGSCGSGKGRGCTQAHSSVSTRSRMEGPQTGSLGGLPADFTGPTELPGPVHIPPLRDDSPPLDANSFCPPWWTWQQCITYGIDSKRIRATDGGCDEPFDPPTPAIAYKDDRECERALERIEDNEPDCPTPDVGCSPCSPVQSALGRCSDDCVDILGPFATGVEVSGAALGSDELTLALTAWNLLEENTDIVRWLVYLLRGTNNADCVVDKINGNRNVSIIIDHNPPGNRLDASLDFSHGAE